MFNGNGAFCSFPVPPLCHFLERLNTVCPSFLSLLPLHTLHLLSSQTNPHPSVFPSQPSLTESPVVILDELQTTATQCRRHTSTGTTTTSSDGPAVAVNSDEPLESCKAKLAHRLIFFATLVFAT